MKPQHSFLFCIILLFLFTSNSIAQSTPDRLLSNDKIWSIGTRDYSARKGSYEPTYRTHYIKFDSVGAFYSLYEGSFNLQLTIQYDVLRSDNEDMSDWYMLGTVWEVDSLQQIYYRGWGGGLLYDFGAEKGDTLDVYDIHSFRGQLLDTEQTVKYVVDSIDTITILGVERKRMILDPIWDEWFSSKFGVTWISGIGSLNGILFSSGEGIAEDSETLRCLHQGDSLLYGRIDSPCYYSTVDVQEKSFEDSPVTVYPNPTSDLLNIDSYPGGCLFVTVISANGKLILSREMDGTTNQLDLSSFRKGVYFITVRSKDFVTTEKIIKL